MSFFESPRAANSAATHWKSQRGGVASAEMCVRRDTSLAAGQRCSLYSPPPSSASNSPRVCLLAWIPNTFCRSRNTPGKLIVVRITPPTTPPPAESYLRQHLNLKRKKPPSPLFPFSSSRTLHKHGGAAGKKDGRGRRWRGGERCVNQMGRQSLRN